MSQSPFSQDARRSMRPWLFPIAKMLYELAMEQDDEEGASCIARLADERECALWSTEQQLFVMKESLGRSAHAETYLSFFRSYFLEQGVVIEGF